ncbi:hypothetical protein FRC07_002980 [Ceratobasidium sp. 392]|nr:hypothetical protein FRC07_002980 [Ceratobasidium sp. 392]
MAQSALTSARPVVLGDTLSFDTHPDRDEDLMECAVQWKQEGKPRSEKYMVFKSKNVTAGDTDFLVPVFVQKNFYDETFSNANDFTITTKWQYGQRDETGAARFVVLQDQENKPYQRRFVASWLDTLENLIHDVLCAKGYADLADQLDDLDKTYLGDPLLPFASLVVQSGDVLLVPSEPKSYNFGNLKTITWVQDLSKRSAEYYIFTVVNTTQRGQDVIFFIQKEWWDSDDLSLWQFDSLVQKGEYEFKIDAKSQYGQADGTGKNRWVVHHDKKRKPYQHRFVKSVLHSAAESAAQAQAIAGIFGINVGGVGLEGILNVAEGIFGDYLHTFT